MQKYNCLNCNKECSVSQQKTNKYCSNTCQQDYQYKQYIVKWQQTGKIGKTTLKKFLSTKKEGCWTCGITEWNGKPIVLELEHIDGNSENNSEDNVSLICPNCHSQTETYKAKNKGNGRHFRMQRYYEGKSF